MHHFDSDVNQAIIECQRRLSSTALRRVRLWLTSEAYSDHVSDILGLIADQQWDTLEQSFATVLPFGTGGRRGPRGVGPNRINARTIAESARGLVNWARNRRTSNDHRTPSGTIVIAYDTRIASRELAVVCAEVIAAAGMTAIIFDDCRPTPELSFAVRHLNADAGIVISASHNPPTDNGFKAYGPDGGQIPPPKDAEVMRSVKRLSGKPIPRVPYDQALSLEKVKVIGPEIDAAYHAAVRATGLSTSHTDSQQETSASHSEVKIVYTPLHGTGMHSLPPVLAAAGFADVTIVAAQADPDGSFPTVPDGKPNPEEIKALEQAGDLACEIGADIAIGTDPDADRLGCIVLRRNPEPVRIPLSGNQIATVLCAYVLERRSALGMLNPDGLVLTTTVTSPMIGKIARAHGVGVIDNLLVGFKYIACVLGDVSDPDRVVFACEESHGYLSGHYTRDKDAACAALLLAEAAAAAKARGSDLWQQLDAVYSRFGYHADLMFSEELSPAGGRARIRRMTNGLRSSLPAMIGGYRVTRVIDRLSATEWDPVSNTVSPYPAACDPYDGAVLRSLLPARDNLLIFELAGDDVLEGARLAIRPSGTEPKCKFYVSAWTGQHGDLELARSQTDARTRALQHAFVDLARSYA